MRAAARAGGALLASLLAFACGGEDAPDPASDTLEASSEPSATYSVPTPDGPLTLDAGVGWHGVVGEPITLRAEASPGVVAYTWDAGDGRSPVGPLASPEVTLVWDRADRHRVVVTAEDAWGRRRTAQTTVAVMPPRVFQPATSSSVQVSADGSLVVAVSEAADLVTLVPVADGRPGPPRRVATCVGPRQVALGLDSIAIACPSSDTVVILAPEQTGGAWAERTWREVQRLERPWGARPHGVLFDPDDDLWVAEQGAGALVRFGRASGGDRELAERIEGLEDARGLSRLPGGALAVTRWRSDPEDARVWRVDVDTGEVTPWTFGYERVADTSVTSSGVPTWLEQLAVAPDGLEAALGGLQANVLRGPRLSGEPLTFETTMRAILVRVNPATGEELPLGRKQFDNRGFTSAVAYSTVGDWVWVAHRGHRSVERLDRFSGAQGGTLLDVGFAPSGLAVSPDDRWIVVEATYSRALRFFDTSARGLPVDVGTVSLVEEEPWSPEVLRGAQLFNDTFDVRVARDGYIACGHCHLDGDADRFVWDFSDRGEGLRRTIPLIGRAGLGHGPLHWSANFDELQDFELVVRGIQGGRGLMDDEAFARTAAPLGPPKAGLSADLDALAAYLTHLSEPLRSPWRETDGSLSAAAERGRAVFERADTGCTTCHVGPNFTDSVWRPDGTPVVHDVGTLGPGSGARLGGVLPGIDTPTLIGIWHSAPYLHDGSAQDIRAVLLDRNAADRHGRTSHLSEGELSDLEAYLLSL